jgi:hypothetical protein
MNTISILASSIIDQAAQIGCDAEMLADDPGIASCVQPLRDAQRALNQANDALQLALVQTEPCSGWAPMENSM